MPCKEKRESVSPDSNDGSYIRLGTKRLKLGCEVGNKTDSPPPHSPYSMGNRLTKSNAAYSDSNEINTTGPSIGPSANGNASLIAGHSDHENKTTANASSQTAPLPCKPMPARSIPYAGYRLVFVADERRDEYVSGYKADDEGDGEKIKKQKLSRARRKKHTFKRYWAGEDELDPKRSENIKSDDDD